MTRLANTPSHCCSCYGQNSELRHVDFDAAYDGPVIPGSPHIAIDDLVICESCLQEAFDLLDPQGLKNHIEALTAILKAAEEEIRAKDRAIEGMRHATNEIVEHGVVRPGGRRPDMKGLSPETRKIVSEARSERNKEKKQREKLQRKRMSEAAKARYAREQAEKETPSPTPT